LWYVIKGEYTSRFCEQKENKLTKYCLGYSLKWCAAYENYNIKNGIKIDGKVYIFSQILGSLYEPA